MGSVRNPAQYYKGSSVMTPGALGSVGTPTASVQSKEVTLEFQPGQTGVNISFDDRINLLRATVAVVEQLSDTDDGTIKLMVFPGGKLEPPPPEPEVEGGTGEGGETGGVLAASAEAKLRRQTQKTAEQKARRSQFTRWQLEAMLPKPTPDVPEPHVPLRFRKLMDDAEISAQEAPPPVEFPITIPMESPAGFIVEAAAAATIELDGYITCIPEKVTPGGRVVLGLVYEITTERSIPDPALAQLSDEIKAIEDELGEMKNEDGLFATRENPTDDQIREHEDLHNRMSLKNIEKSEKEAEKRAIESQAWLKINARDAFVTPPFPPFADCTPDHGMLGAPLKVPEYGQPEVFVEPKEPTLREYVDVPQPESFSPPPHPEFAEAVPDPGTPGAEVKVPEYGQPEEPPLLMADESKRTFSDVPTKPKTKPRSK